MESANFKRDYVTFLAIGIFILMVTSELFVAVGIPVAINHSTLYAEHGLRQKMVSDFDTLRARCYAANKNPDATATMEKKLILWDLDLLSSHLREYNRSMPLEDVENIISDIQIYNTLLLQLNQDTPEPFCKAGRLKFDNIVNRIENKLKSVKESENIKNQGEK